MSGIVGSTSADGRKVLVSSPSAVWVADHHGRFTEVNSWACRLLGYSRDDYLRRRVAEMIRPEETERLEIVMGELARGEHVLDTWDVRHADGSWVTFETVQTFTADGHWEGIGRQAGTTSTRSFPSDPRVAELEEQLARRDKQLESLPAIERAKGILMRDLRFTDDEAFGYLVSLSQDTNTKLRTVAGHVVDRLRATGISASTARATFDELTDLRHRLRGAGGSGDR